MSKRKDSNAVAMGRKGGKARMKTLTPERRSEIARLGAYARNGTGKPSSSAKPGRWYGLVALPADYVWKGVAHASKVLDQLHASPEVILWSRDRAEVTAR